MSEQSNVDMNSSALNAAKTQLRSAMKQRLAGLTRDSIALQSRSAVVHLGGGGRGLGTAEIVNRLGCRQKCLRLVVQVQTVRRRKDDRRIPGHAGR